MPLHRGRHSIAGEMTAGVRRHKRRHSASDILLKVLQRRRSSALEMLSSSSHRLMVAISMNQPQPPTEQKTRRCNHTEGITRVFSFRGFYDDFSCNKSMHEALTNIVRLFLGLLFFFSAANARVPTARYTKMGETLRHVIPGHMQCSMACGGKACKYENPSRWSDEEQAVKGLYSSWYVGQS